MTVLLLELQGEYGVACDQMPRMSPFTRQSERVSVRWGSMTWVALLSLLFAAPGAAQLVPTQMRHYTLLQQALVRYRDLATDPTLTQLPPLQARSVRVGEPYTGSEALRRLLRATGRPDRCRRAHSARAAG
jgi:hypothetical protein